MLIVSRSLDQSVIVGEFDGLELMLKVTVLGVRGKKVRLGFEVLSGDLSAPSDVREQFPAAQRNLSKNRPTMGAGFLPARLFSPFQPDYTASPGMATTQDWSFGEDAKGESARTPHRYEPLHVTSGKRTD